jgi:phage/plasmid-like protein (TIGR03299 family)
MSHEFESGIFLREGAWHRLGKVLKDWPGSWDAACKEADLTWDVETIPLEVGYEQNPGLIIPGQRHVAVGGYQLLKRSDMPLVLPNAEVTNPKAVLGIQPTSYHVIKNSQFGEVIEHIIGTVGDDWQYETLIALSGGRQIVCVLKAREPLQIGPDPSKTYVYIAFVSRHDGQGGLKGIPTNIRVVCRNTRHAAENQAKRDGVGFTIRHTSSWKEQIDKAAQVVQAAVKEGKAWQTLATRLGGVKLVPAQRDRALKNLFVTTSAMSEREVANTEQRREQVREILRSETCTGIDRTWLGLVQAVDEWCDHVRPARNDETRMSRSMLRAEPLKARVMAMARVNVS